MVDNAGENSIMIYAGANNAFTPKQVQEHQEIIEKSDFVLGFDLEYYNVVEDVNGIDRKEIFCNLIKELCQAGAKISMYQDGELITLEVFNNWLKTLDEISQQTECDIDRELEFGR